MNEGKGARQRWLLPELSVMSRRCGYIYISNFKAGCSTVRRSLWKAEHQLGFTTTPPGDPHDVSRVPFEHNAHGRWEDCEDKFVFTFVRNPYARILSAYLDKIAVQQPRVWPQFAAAHGLGDRRVTFLEFLELLTAEEPAAMDPHWRPQTLLVGYGVVPFDYVGTLENLASDLREVMRRIFGTAISVEDFAPHRTGAADQLASYVTPEAQKLIAKLYEADFANFGYSTTLNTPRTGGFVLRPGLREPMQVLGRCERLFAAGDHAGAHRALEELTRWGEWPHLARRRAICLREVGKAKRKKGLEELRRIDRRGWGNRGDAGILPVLLDLLAPAHKPRFGGAVDLGITELRLAAELLPMDMTVHKHLGLSLLAAGELEDGIEALIRAASLREPVTAASQKRLRHYRRRLAVLRARRRGHEAGLDVLLAREAGSASLADRLLVKAASLAGKTFGARAQVAGTGVGHRRREGAGGVVASGD